MEEKIITRRATLKKIARDAGLVIGLSGLLTLLNFTAAKIRYGKKPFDGSLLKEHIPLLREIIDKEWEGYTALPKVEGAVRSLEDISERIYPEVQRSLDDFLGQRMVYPGLTEKPVSFRNPIAYGLVAVGWYYLFNRGERRMKSENLRSAMRLSKYIGFANFSAGAVFPPTGIRGYFDKDSGKTTIDTGIKDDYMALLLAHETAHSLYFDRVKRKYPDWVVEGFAHGLAHAAVEDKKAIKEDSLIHLVNAYDMMRGDLQALPESLDQFRFGSLGYSYPNEYTYGYAFFRIMDQQKGTSIYRKILEDGDLRCLEPLPGE